MGTLKKGELVTKTSLFLIVSLTVVACSQNNYQFIHKPDSQVPVSIKNCNKLIQSVESTIKKAGVKDSQDRRIIGFPYLRVNRFFSSFRNKVFDVKFEQWVEQLRQKGLTGWEVELQNLPPQYKNELNRHTVDLFSTQDTIEEKLAGCSKTLTRYELQNKGSREQLRQNAVVSSEYRMWQQVLGLYPLSALPFKIGIYKWHQKTKRIFNTPLASLPIEGKLLLYRPKQDDKKLSWENVADILQKSTNNELKIPLPTELQQQMLFDTFSPIFEINVNSKNDKIGKPEWTDDRSIAINTDHPVVHKQLSHTKFNGSTLLQLNYIIWFPSRPKTSLLDLLGGHLDGIIWRVTLNANGEPLIFDSIHMCGCYHFFFPSQKLKRKKTDSWYKEPDFVPQNNFNFDFNKDVTIRISANQHYVQKIYSETATHQSIEYYQLEKADNLRSISLPNDQRRSLYNQKGFIVGSERGERYLFWPMGVPNAGAMRQWGHHATAFVGRRHFDDAYLFETSFEYIPDQPSQ